MADSTTFQQSAAGSQLPPPSTQPATQSTEAPTSSAETVTASNNPQSGDSSVNATGSADRDIDLGGADPIDDAIDNDINMNNAEDMSAVTKPSSVVFIVQRVLFQLERTPYQPVDHSHTV